MRKETIVDALVKAAENVQGGSILDADFWIAVRDTERFKPKFLGFSFYSPTAYREKVNKARLSRMRNRGLETLVGLESARQAYDMASRRSFGEEISEQKVLCVIAGMIKDFSPE